MANKNPIDKITAILATARRLPIDSRQAIVDELTASIKRDEGRIRAVDRIAQLIPIAEEVFGCTYNPDRKADSDTLVRNVCAYVMHKEDYSFPAIGRSMHRAPSSACVMAQRAKEMERGFFGKDIQEKFNEFIERV